ncbi:MAG TPA: hypothetical protein VG984_01540 [Candidatus Paceibacterota bacterium]|nr:hypothetical protein [Candidatus Paceibacterota bacterium]
MTKLMGRDAILGMATAAPTVSNKDILLAAAALIEARLPNQPAWYRFHSIERLKVGAQRMQLIEGTVLQTLADAATQLGAPLKVGKKSKKTNVGHVVDRGLMTLEQVHGFSCGCGDAITDADAATEMRKVADACTT